MDNHHHHFLSTHYAPGTLSPSKMGSITFPPHNPDMAISPISQMRKREGHRWKANAKVTASVVGETQNLTSELTIEDPFVT